MKHTFRALTVGLFITGLALAGCSGSKNTAEAPESSEEAVSPQAAIAGDWRGQLNAIGASLRIVVHVVEAADGSLTATMDSPDQGAYGIQVSEVQFDGSRLRLEVNAIGGAYQGTLDDDGMVFDGEWTQGGQTFVLDLERVEG